MNIKYSYVTRCLFSFQKQGFPSAWSTALWLTFFLLLFSFLLKVSNILSFRLPMQKLRTYDMMRNLSPDFSKSLLI